MTERVYTVEEISEAMRVIYEWSKQGAPPPVKTEKPTATAERIEGD